MSLLVTLSKSPDASAATGTSKTFDTQGGTIGRGDANTWIIEDPEHFVSSTHCRISTENGQFYLLDLSTNGTFLNGSHNAMGKGTKQPLASGDSFLVGEYEFSVSLGGSQSGSSPVSDGPYGGSPPGDIASGTGNTPFVKHIPGGPVSDPNSPSDIVPGKGNDVVGFPPTANGGIESHNTPWIQEKTDGDVWGGTGTPDDSPWGGENTGDNGWGGADNPADPWQSISPEDDKAANPLTGSMDPPVYKPDETPYVGEPKGAPSTGWGDSPPQESPDVLPLDTGHSLPNKKAYEPIIQAPIVQTPIVQAPIEQTPIVQPPLEALQEPVYSDSAEYVTSEKYQKLLDSNAQLKAEIQLLQSQQRHSPSGGAPLSDGNMGLLAAMGFQLQDLSSEEASRITAQAGEVIREMITGLIKVLNSRSMVKNIFRMNVTVIQPMENNPLKFSANLEDALENMFLKQGNAYMNPVEAVQEGLNGIAEHQVAIIAGMQAAFKGVVERFDPETLNARFTRHQKSSIFPVNQDARNWEAFVEYYKGLVGDTDDAFQSLFGDEFVSAYEEQLHKLSFARKANNNP